MAVITTVRDAARDPRVALSPAVAKQLVAAGHKVQVEKGVGTSAGFTDSDYTDAGASLVAASAAAKAADVLVSVGRPDDSVLAALRPGAALIAQLDVWDNPSALEAAAKRGVNLIALERLPRQISRAQTMDVLSSQASIAGYRAALVAAHAYGRYLPMMVTAAGTAKPASVLVLGAGVAGLQAIATARRLGARVSGYDVRAAAREEVTSLGATFLDPGVDAEGAGGYARELTKEETAAQQERLAEAIAAFDIIIATAKVPGRTPPLLVTAKTVEALKPGSVIVDLAASRLGGNVAGSVDGKTVVSSSGVTIIGAGSIAAEMAPAASDAFARNVQAVLTAITVEGEITIDPADDVIGAMLYPPVVIEPVVEQSAIEEPDLEAAQLLEATQ
jgi:NAD(P) transhydrogenase subunit alpha